MTAITKPGVREIIDDFAEEIRQRKITTTKPSKTVINFRNEYIDKHERDIVKVPIDILRYRKDKIA